MPHTHHECNILIVASNVQADPLLNLEFSWQYLPASATTILELLNKTIETDERIRSILDAWAASGDLHCGAAGHNDRLSGVQVWCARSQTTLNGVRDVAERLALENIPPDFVITNKAAAISLSRSLGHQSM
ncbi:hypothetical protein [Paraburkholderia azotifigens]|uniref:Uncharacterized protein n=1 Tax=Paraburkholderia azotifigens TaxID=2057004 RepID=A0A5C6V3N5_9BURK|nr:hypothetical protein [Paraburkholderia azotifigens]TXC79126.1 hypothetical protein FRZ40_32430 [Paraburkholderia azotifigens]